MKEIGSIEKEESEIEDFGDEEVEAKPSSLKPKFKQAVNKTSREVIEEGDRYKPFKQPERMGIIDDYDNKVFSEDLMEILAKILSKLDRIERATNT